MLLVRAGMSPLEALKAATLRPAEFLHLEKISGSVDAGKIADLVLLDANPLDDITNTQRIAGVVANGRYFTRHHLDKMLSDAESAARPK